MTDPLARLSAALADRYRVERELGAGGMATVYLAEDLKHHRKVAIKVLREDLAASLGAARFLREIEIAAALQHPHILPLLDSGLADGLLYYVMPFVAGRSLRDRLAHEGELPIGEAVRIVVEVVDALAHAHEQGVVHRDIKPDNVMLTGRHALVTDFGVAKAVSEATGRHAITTLGIALGTPPYMSPEQASASTNIDHRSDIYAVGTVAYEVLAGRPPFVGATPQQVLAAHVTETPDPISRYRPSIAPALEAVIMRCLAKLPADRWQSCQELLSALEPFATPSGGTTPTTTRPFPAASRRRAPWLAGAGVVVALLAAGLIIGRPGPPRVSLGSATRVTAEAGLELFPDISPDGKLIAYAMGNTTRMRVFIRSTAGTRSIPLTDDTAAIQVFPRWSPDGERVLFLMRGGAYVAPALGGRAQPVIPEARDPVSSATWSGDGRELAFVRGDSLFVTPAQGGTARFVTTRYALRTCAWSPAGSLIACVWGNTSYLELGPSFGNLAPSRIFVVNARGGPTRDVTDSVSLNQSPAWSADGRLLYYVSNRLGARDIWVRRISPGGAPRGDAVRLTIGLNAQTIALSADGRRMAYSVYTETANIASLPIPSAGPVSASAARPLTSGSQIVESVRASLDGKWLLYDSDLSGNSDIYRIPIDGGVPERLTTDSADEFSGDLSPDGREIAFHSFRTGSRDIVVLPLGGGAPQFLTSSPLQEREPFWSPDGATLAYTESVNSEVFFVKRRPDGSWGTPTRRTQRMRVTAWSSDGRWLLATRRDTMLILRADSGDARPIYIRRGPDDPSFVYPHFSPDGKTVYFKSFDAAGAASFWSMPASGGRPRKLVTFDDPDHPSPRPDWSTDGKRFFFNINDRQSDVWVVELRGG